MIVRSDGDSLLLIRQPDHAGLSRFVMEHWLDDSFVHSPRRASILSAIEEHDNGWNEPDAAPILDPSTGRILDFITVPAAVKQAVWPRGVERLADDPWAAALVAQHAVHVNGHHRGSGEWAAFFTTMETACDQHRERAGLTQDDLWRDYTFVRLGDLASLVFCNAWTTQQHEGYTLHRHDTVVTVTPDPFQGHDVALEVSARVLPNRRFASAADAAQAFADGQITAIHGVIRGEPAGC
jgi:hypothetical protein